MSKKLDVQLQPEGTITLFHLLSNRARTFVRDNVDTDGATWFGKALAVQHSYVDILVSGMVDNGLRVR